MSPARKIPRPKAKRAVATQAPDDPASRVLRRFRLVFNAVKTHFREVEKKAGVAGAQLWALSVIQGNPGLTVTAVARGMDIHQSTASNLVKGLISRELVFARKSDAGDRRTVQLRLTAAGARVLRRAPGPLTGVLPAALASMDARTLARLERDLDQLIAALGADERGAGIPLGQPAR